MRTLYNLSYKNASGKITKAQIQESLQRIAKTTTSGDDAQKKLGKNVDELMSGLEMPEHGIDYNTFVRNALHLIETHQVSHAVESVFGAMDYDTDGLVSYSEYERFLTCFNADTSKAREYFDAFDKDKSGTLSKREFQDGLVRFYTSTDENDPSRYAFGPLVT